jgi:general secretion pathway protein A
LLIADIINNLLTLLKMNTSQELVTIMYESFYGLREKPFTLLPDPEYLYLSPKHQRALTLLEYGMMNQAGFSVICGDTGAGKTTLIRRLLTELGDDTRVGLITNTHQSFGELLNWVLMAFGLDGDGKSKAQMHQIFIAFLIEQYAQNKHTVLIVDEAQNMNADTLEELRMLSNINADKDQVFQVILAGQPALRETLRKPELMQFAQRIAVDYYLESLSIEETSKYIHYRLKIAGSEKEIFTADACEAVFKYSGGTPRLINLLCDTSMVYGFAEQNEQINEQLVHDVVREQHSNSIIPAFNVNHAAESKPEDVTESEQEIRAVEQKVEPQVVNPPVDLPVEAGKTDEVVSGLAQQAQNAQQATQQTAGVLSNADQAISVKQAELMSAAVEKAKNRNSSVEHINEKLTDIKDESNVTPIKVNQTDVKNGEIGVDENEMQATAQEQQEKLPASEKSDAETAKSSADDGSKQNADIKQDDTPSEKAAPYISRSHHQEEDDDTYPIVHIEENPRKGINLFLVAIVSGMFVASIVMMAAAWVMFGSSDNRQQTEQNNQSQQSQQDVKNRELIAIQKERDAALAVTRALERERDAALQAAKAQKEIRAAELRATEILAAQEREAEKRLQQARARARAAERAESKALARERKLKRATEKRQAELEAQRLHMLREERLRLEALATEVEKAKLQQIEEETVVVDKKPVAEVIPEKESKKKESFSANPCNSPSAKFLSTCKK